MKLYFSPGACSLARCGGVIKPGACSSKGCGGVIKVGACSLGTTGSNGPDRIVHNAYDAANDLISTQSAYGTTDQQTNMTNAYTANGKLDYVDDANGNRTDYTYDDASLRLSEIKTWQPASGDAYFDALYTIGTAGKCGSFIK